MVKSKSSRPQKVGQLVKQELSRLLIEGLRDPRIGFVTITEVRVSGDLRQARVFASVYGSDQERKSSVDGLTAAAGYLKRELGRALRLKFVPELLFELDTSLDAVERLDDIIQAIEAGEEEVPGVSHRPPVSVATDRSALNESAERMDADHRRELTKSKKSNSSLKKGARRKPRRSKD